MPTYDWTALKRTGARNRHLPSFEVSNHPLKTTVVSSMLESPSKSFMDQLNKWSSNFEEVDPLLKFEQMNLEEDVPLLEVVDEATDYELSWNTRRTNILNKYTTGEKLTIVSSFLPGGEKTLIRQVSNLNEKVKHRLEQLDEFDESSVRKTMGLSQLEYVSKINMLNEEIKKAWETEQRVKAFKIGIQCSKLLSDISVMHFYPSKFILITDILDTFGNLVFDRLMEKSFGKRTFKNIMDIDSTQVPESAKETCQNWMYKMASIRELLPRMYMEMCLLKCYVFISREEVAVAVARLAGAARGLADPLAAGWLRTYLCRAAGRLLGPRSEHFYCNTHEFLDNYQQIFKTSMIKRYEAQLLTLDRYLSLYVPALEWMISGTLRSHTGNSLLLLDEFLHKCDQMENNELFLYCIVSSFDSASIIKRSSKILEMIHNSADKMVLLNEILASLGEHMCADGRQMAPEALMQTFWKVASGMRSAAHFLQVLEPWLQFACVHLSSQHVNILLRGTIRNMIKWGRSADQFSGNFLFVIKRIMNFMPDVEEVFLMDAFMPLVELGQTPAARAGLARAALSAFFARLGAGHIHDHIVIASLMRLCCILHDSINAVTVDDEVKVCSDLINKFVRSVTYEEDLEQQLNFYVECRSSFIKLDAVLVALVHAVCRGSRQAPGRGLPRAAAAFCFVTAPSLRCPLHRAQLYLLSGQTALLNNCIGQAEANFKALIGLIPDIPEFVMEDGQQKSTNFKVAAILSDFLSTLLVLPDNVDSNCRVYILSGFIKTMEIIHWRKTDPLYYTTLLHTLDLLCEMTQEHYAHHIDGVLSNDKLYGSEEEFIEIVEKYATNICQELLIVLKALGETNETKKQFNLAIELFWRVIRKGDLRARPMANLAANLWILTRKLDSNNRVSKAVLSSLQSASDAASQQLLQKLTS